MSRRALVPVKGGYKVVEAKEMVEMADGRTYFTDDGWTMVYLRKRSGSVRLLKGKEADLGRFLAVSQSSAGPS